jgi:hypothetical protein
MRAVASRRGVGDDGRSAGPIGVAFARVVDARAPRATV